MTAAHLQCPHQNWRIGLEPCCHKISTSTLDIQRLGSCQANHICTLSNQPVNFRCY
jgi:hypothetical protein